MPSSSLTARESRVIFRSGRDYTVRDVIDAAYFRGELKPRWEELLRGVEAERESRASDLEVDDEAVATAAEAFRYERDLISAEETEQWIEERGLTLEDFSDYFIRVYWRNALDTNLTPEPIAFRSASPELRELLTAELFFSGEFDRMTKELTWQVAARSAVAGDDLPSDLKDAERERFFAREGIGADELPGLLDQLERDPSWFAEMISLQAIYRRQCEILLSGAAPSRELATLRLPLTRFEIEVVEVESRDSAAEASFCIREDGMSMEEVAAEARYPYHRTTVLLEDIPADSQQKFLSVSAGVVLDPICRGDGFQLCRVTGKSEPTLDDPVVRTRVEKRILERHFPELTAKHIEWASVMPTS
jgi:hypothetical protein